MAGRMINGAAALAELIRPASSTDEPGIHRMLPVLPELSSLLPGRGLRRGSTVAIAAAGATVGGSTSLLLALLSLCGGLFVPLSLLPHAVQTISSFVCPWVGGPSESSSGRARK